MGILSKFINDVSKLAPKASEKRGIPNFKVKTWGIMQQNLNLWQSENARDQWKNAKYSSKPLYHYSWMRSSDRASLRPEPKNEFDNKAIAVYLDDVKIGYVPSEINEDYHNKLIKNLLITVEVHGGDRKYIDEYGDIVKEKGDAIAEVVFDK